MGGCSKGRRKVIGQAVTAVGAGVLGHFVAGAEERGAPASGAPGVSAPGVSEPAAPAVSDGVLGYCGLYCGGCQTYQETRVGAAKDAEGKPTRCDGCASSVLAPWCAQCAIRDCARAKGLRYCLLCPDNPCDKVRAFMNDPRYPYHKDVQADMARLREIGTDPWLREQAARWTCRSCGNKYHWFARKCPTCGTRVNEKYWPD
jgi:hypothetical protein